MNKEATKHNAGSVASVTESADLHSAARISDWLADYLSKTLKIDRSGIDIDARFERYSIDSLLLVVMTEELEKWLGVSVDPTAPFEHPTIRSLAEHLAKQKQSWS